MKKMLILSVMSLLAFSMINCKDNGSSAKEDNYDDVDIFVVQSKTETVETSQEDANWKTCAQKHDDKSQFYINEYIYKYGNFSTSVSLIQERQADESHDNVYIGLPPPMDKHEWLEREFDVKTFNISFSPEFKELTVVSPSVYDLVGNNVIQSPSRVFIKIAKQNNDVNYNGYYWQEGRYSYIPTKFVHITCLQDFDAKHPKGTVLDDITTVYYRSAKPFIQSGYKNMRLQDGCIWTIDQPELVSEFNTKKVNLIEGLRFSLRLKEQPEKAGVYQFKLTYKDISGQQQSAVTIPIRLIGQGN